MGCQLSGSQGVGISDSASLGKGDFPFPHEDRRDVTLWRLYVFFACRGFRKPPSPLFTPPAPSEGGRGRRKATQGLGLVGSRPVGWQPTGVPLLRGSGVSKPYLASIFPSLNQLTLFLNVSRNSVSIPAHVAVIDPHNHQPYSPHLPVSFLVAKTSFRREM